MVVVSNYFEVKTLEGKTFVSLELSGGLELVQSQISGKFYATTRKCRISSTFDVEVAKQMIGSTLNGDIVRVEVEPYDYAIPSTGEIITLAHSYSYKPAGSMELVGQSKIKEIAEP
ncbi:hypothetical protein [Aquirufa aurantiipilula]|uniref:hypothetical protein n=1 Tax=Aquirufa aurantiipilula TaxID=2696561 RepID=UPI001CAA4A50|nr:hypothetical protein [Aquirufa aurantiipilula]MBZ1327016.1 hypothetical protein [Aquirufa aurantiipilula]